MPAAQLGRPLSQVSRVSPLPPAELGRWLALERFDYSRVGRQWAVLRLLAGLADQLGAPAQAMLVITQGQRRETFPARACALERRLGERQTGLAASGLLWRAFFAVPLERVEFEDTLFELTAAGRIEFGLPSPKLRIVTRQALRFADPSARTCPRGRGPVAGQMRHRIGALATTVAVTATSTPAVSLAATGLTRNLPAETPAGAASGTDSNAVSRPGIDVHRATHAHAHAHAHARVESRAVAEHKVIRVARHLSATHPANGRQPGTAPPAAKSASRPAVTRTAVTHVFSRPSQASSPKVCRPKTGPIYAHAAAPAKRLTTGHLPARRTPVAAGCRTPTTGDPVAGSPVSPPTTTTTTTPPSTSPAAT